MFTKFWWKMVHGPRTKPLDLGNVHHVTFRVRVEFQLVMAATSFILVTILRDFSYTATSLILDRVD